MEVFIDPRSTINYSSFYIQGLYDFFGKKKVRFLPDYFDDLREIDMLMAFVVINKEEKKKYIIDYRDQSDFIEEALQWCDTYAKINLNTNTLPKDTDKIINIPPSFPIKIWNPLELFYHLCQNFFQAKIFRQFRSPNIHLRPKRMIRNYLSLLKRQKLHDYIIQYNPKNNNYLFFVSTFWPGHSQTNSSRYYYMMACKQIPKAIFFGGFFIDRKMRDSIPKSNDLPRELLFHKFLSNKTYLKNIKKSAFVFNTPAVWDCHGWKLGEYLCLGKAIISMPLVNELPVSLEHEKHIYYVNNKEEIKNAVALLFNDNELKNNLEREARIYYEKYASPVKVIESIIGRSTTSVCKNPHSPGN